MSHSLTSNVKRTEGVIRPQRNEDINEENTDIERTNIERTHEIDTNRRASIDYERTGLAD